MGVNRLAEILAAHAEQLGTGKVVQTDAFLVAFPEERDELAPLLNVATRVQRTLKPVASASAFRARLRDGLLMAAHHRQTHRVLVERQGEPPWGWLLGAAALGSAAGLLAVVLHSRAQEHKAAVQPPTH
jgi:hypothetical protein